MRMSLRAFIALELPGEVQDAISASTTTLQKALPRPLVRWVTPHNIHLTLKFLGDIAPTDLERLAGVLKADVAGLEPFRLNVAGLGAFPTPRRARVIWVGVELPPALTSLQRRVELLTASPGSTAEEGSFSPHLTIGRVGQGLLPAETSRVQAALESTRIGDLGSVHVTAVAIFKSDLQPGGSVYTRLYSLPMKPA